MGCGAGAHAAPPPPEKEESIEEGTSWATKTGPSGNLGGPSSNGLPLFTASANGGSSLASSKHDHNVILLDADDDDDEIEIIYESPSKQQALRHASAANGQEPPEAIEMLLEVHKPEPKPLSKQQQDEAALLADRRKRFDNQRYQGEQRQQQQQQQRSAEPAPHFSPTSPKYIQAPHFRGGYPAEPTTDMNQMMGLNIGAAANNDKEFVSECLPGGIIDDEDDFQRGPQVKSRQQHAGKQNRHDEGFDDDDEKLMMEIEQELNI